MREKGSHQDDTQAARGQARVEAHPAPTLTNVGSAVRAGLSHVRPRRDAVEQAEATLVKSSLDLSRVDHPRGPGFRDAAYGTTRSAQTAGGHYLPVNRFEWWEAAGSVPPTGALNDRTGGPDVEQSSFAAEFNSSLTTVVGDASGDGDAARHPHSRLIDWSAGAGVGTANDVPGMPFFFGSSSGADLTVLTTRRINVQTLERDRIVARNIDPGTGRPAHGSITLVFGLPQRAVGVEVGYLSSLARPDSHPGSYHFHLVARRADGREIDVGGSLLVFTDSVGSNAQMVPMAVRDRDGSIVSVEIRLDRTALTPDDQLFLGRVWCEALPPAAVWQGVITLGDPAAFTAESHPEHPDIAAGRVLRGGSLLQLPFGCDRAVTVPRGFHLTSTHEDPGETRGFGFELVAEPMFSTVPGGRITLGVSGFWSNRVDKEETSTAVAAVYVTVLAWDSRQVDLYAAGVHWRRGLVPNSQTMTVSVPNPSPAAAAAIRDGQNPWEVSGTLVAGLTALRMDWQGWATLDAFKHSVGSVTGAPNQVMAPPWSISFGEQPIVEPLTPPVLTHEGDHVLWTAKSSLGDTDTGYWSATLAWHSDYGVIVTGQGLRTPLSSVQWLPVFPHARRATQRTPYFVSGSDVLEAGRAIPIEADLACVSLGQVVILPNGRTIRGFDVEVRGEHFTGEGVAFAMGGGGDTGRDNDPFVCIGTPSVFGVIRRSQSVRERLVTRDARFAWYDGFISLAPEVLGAVRNEGNTSVMVTRFAMGGLEDEFSVQIGYRGEALGLFDADVRARNGQLWLDPGEAFTVGGQFYTAERSHLGEPGPDRAVAIREATLIVMTNGFRARRAVVMLRAVSMVSEAAGNFQPARVYLGRTRLSPPGTQQQTLRGWALIDSFGPSALSVRALTFQPPVPGLIINVLEGARYGGTSPFDPAAIYQIDPGASLLFQIDFTPQAAGDIEVDLIADTNAGVKLIRVVGHVD